MLHSMIAPISGLIDQWWIVLESNQDPPVMSRPRGHRANDPYTRFSRVSPRRCSDKAHTAHLLSQMYFIGTIHNASACGHDYGITIPVIRQTATK